MKPVHNNKTPVIRIASPVIEEQQESPESLQALLTREETVAQLEFTRNIEEGIDIPYRTIKECTFRNCMWMDSTLKSAQFSDVVFRQCDLSNVSFAECSFYRVEFIDCKLMGTNFGESTLNHVNMTRCHNPYINLSMSKMNQVRFDHCDFQQASLHDCRFQATAFDHCSLVQADFSHSRLRYIDLRTCRISGLQLNLPDLQGAIVSSSQAIELLPLLGVVILDE